ncbi:Piwi-domain-containing protein [Morchella conica CCBAS932]|uniref:Piwi-domain-containing protein n=2 Tax=Morchella sect. Distantes TaxID=1051054 RepID=A0A3N4KNJ2_9PEZI|nr:Piwi-domain-containing protein [Morchella conica CCBAS932]
MQPEIKIKRMKKRVFKILEMTAFQSQQNIIATDYSKTIITPSRLKIENDRLQIEITYYDEGQTITEKSKKYMVTIQLVQLIDPGEFQKYVDGNNRDYDPGSAIQALNIILSKAPTNDPAIIPNGRSKFFVNSDPRPLGKGLVALRGYYSSIRPSISRILCNVNVCMTAFYRETDVATLIYEFTGASPGATIPPNIYGRLGGFLKRLRISTSHIKGPNGKPKVQAKAIIGIGHGRAAKDIKFMCEEFAKEVSIPEYFKRKYNITLRHPNLPCVDVGTRDMPIMLPPEIATVLPGQAYGNKLMDEQTAHMITYACRNPKENAGFIVGEGLTSLGLNPPTPHLGPFNIQVSTEMITVPARILTPPTIKYANSTMAVIGASWNLRNVKFAQGASTENFGVIVLEETGGRAQLDWSGVAANFRDMCNKSGMRVGATSPQLMRAVSIPYPNERSTASLEKAISPAFAHMQAKKPKIILVFLPTTDKAVYSMVKYLGDVKYGISTVCAQSSKISKMSPQYMANVALKFNLKLMGRNHGLPPADLGMLAEGTTMIVGCDVTHPSPGSLRGTPSIAGVVASVDAHFAQWPASLRLQESRKEMISGLKEMMIERLQRWNSVNGKFPQRIIVYRDGVSEGQFQTVIKEELPLIRAACQQCGDSKYRPKISIIIVGKRHHTRFYPTDKDKADRLGNPAPGTVVDRGVTAVYDFDFYLQAHSGLQGTTRPAHYYVIHDKNDFKSNQLQTLTHNLCYLFGRATKSVSICPPAYYADLVCERGRCYIYGLLNAPDTASLHSSNSEEEAAANFKKAVGLWGDGPHPNLLNTMYYL